MQELNLWKEAMQDVWQNRAEGRLKEQQKRQIESDPEWKALAENAETRLGELEKLIDDGEMKEKLAEYRCWSEKGKERLEYLSYVAGGAEAIGMLGQKKGQLAVMEIATELEELLAGYKNLYGLIETFGNGAKEVLGQYGVTGGIYSIADALDSKNKRLERLFHKIMSVDG